MMTTLTAQPGRAFLQEMARRFPDHAYSCLNGGCASRLRSPQDWLASVPEESRTEEGLRPILEAQLGPRWRGLENERAMRILALRILAAVVDGQDVRPVLVDLNDQALPHSSRRLEIAAIRHRTVPDVGRADATIERLAHGRKFSNIVAMEIVRQAFSVRNRPSASAFLMFREIDPVMWLLIDGHGRPHPFVDIAGIVCHDAMERTNGISVDEPYVGDLPQVLATLARGL